jgi:hypothetical protein
MIVSNFTPGSSGALQGVDLLARAPKAQQQDGGTSSFSDLLGAPDRPGAPVAAVREARPSAFSTSARPGAPATAQKKAFECATSVGEIQVPNEQSAADGVSAAVPATGALDEAPPLFRDPRLDDPAELALEAAAIAIAAVLLQKAQEPLPQPVVVEEAQTDLFANHEGGGSHAETNTQGDASAVIGFARAVPPNSSSLGVSAAPAEVAEQGVVQISAVKVQVVQAGIEAVIPTFGVQVGRLTAATPEAVTPEGIAAQPKAAAVNPLPLLPTLVESAESSFAQAVNVGLSKSAAFNSSAEVVLTATPSQAVALAAAGQALLSPDLLAATVLLPLVPAVFLDKDSSPAVEGESVEPPPLQDDPERPLATTVEVSPSSDFTSEVLADGALGADLLPESPAKAFFAGRAQMASPRSSSGSAPDQGPADPATSALPALAADPAMAGEDGSAQADEKAQREDTVLSQLREAPASAKEGSGLKSKPVSSQSSFSLQAEPEVGTLGAKEGAVQSENPTVLEYPRESAAQANAKVEASDASSSPALEASLTAPTQGPVTARPAQGVLSRPTVLSPVSVKTGELFNVVQNALERARSENPSHLAVEITLDDGSSFGLEVRMNASGLQASFRSESQPLLKALENSWAGFLAKESADSKVVSAAFEGRSGFGEFSNNGSNAGERREQFEDSASAAFLANQDGGGTAQGKPQAEAARKDLEATGGMALYA